jgi:hypothetical protein
LLANMDESVSIDRETEAKANYSNSNMGCSITVRWPGYFPHKNLFGLNIICRRNYNRIDRSSHKSHISNKKWWRLRVDLKVGKELREWTKRGEW